MFELFIALLPSPPPLPSHPSPPLPFLFLPPFLAGLPGVLHQASLSTSLARSPSQVPAGQLPHHQQERT